MGHVSERLLIVRINRMLAPNGEMLHVTRNAAWGLLDLGHFHITDASGAVVWHDNDKWRVVGGRFSPRILPSLWACATALARSWVYRLPTPCAVREALADADEPEGLAKLMLTAANIPSLRSWMCYGGQLVYKWVTGECDGASMIALAVQAGRPAEEKEPADGGL